MSHSISSFIGKFQGGFRPNRFRVTGQVGVGMPTSEFHIKSASLPGSTISTLQIPYRGRFFKLPGNRLYDPWTITVLDDKPSSTNGAANSGLWGAFHAWSEQFNHHDTNEIDSAIATNFGAQPQTSTGTITDDKGMISWTVNQLDIKGVVTKTITLQNCWPRKVGAIVLSMDNNEELITFPVTLSYQYISITGVN
jgi:hypothetical protein